MAFAPVYAAIEFLDGTGPVLLCMGLLWLGLICRGRDDPWLRAGAALLCAALAVRYLAWRLTDGVPESQGLLVDVWVGLFLVVETASMVSALISHGMLARTRDRREEADIHSRHPVCQAPIDVFIVTYNEALPILERTLVGAVAIMHPDKRIWVLDDGARDWVEALAATHGAQYVRRVKGRHAKAGNVNNGLDFALRTGRPPEFILLLDADFVAGRSILQRTMPLFHAADVGIVQTPQYFFNPDPIQINVFSPTVWPDEQRFFFNVLMPSMDAWGIACCCGTSAVLRVAALQAVGGMATETVTEDMLTSFKMIEHGYRTIYLDEPLSLGLSPEGVGEYVTQRSRWCLGGIQQFHTRWSFLGRGKLRWVDRVNHLSSMLFWGVSFPFRLMLLSVPAIWWWTGASAFNATASDLCVAVLPYTVASLAFNAIYSKNRLVPLLSDINHLVSSVGIIRAVFDGLFRPNGRPFKVTAKGVREDQLLFHWSLMAPFAVLACATISGMVINLGLGNELRNEASYQLNVIWSLLDTVMLALTCLACVDQPRRRVDERFRSGERAMVLVPGARPIPCTVFDIAQGGAALDCAQDWPASLTEAILWLDDGRLQVPVMKLRQAGTRMAVRFNLDRAQRSAMILKLFDRRYSQPIEWVNPLQALTVALRRLMA